MPPFIPSSHIAGTQICVSKIEEATFPSGEPATLQFSYLPRSTMFSQITSRFRWKAVIKTESPKTKLHQLTFSWMYCERECGFRSFDILTSQKLAPLLKILANVIHIIMYMHVLILASALVTLFILRCMAMYQDFCLCGKSAIKTSTFSKD